MTMNELNKKAGRPRNDAQVIQIKFPLPEKGKCIHIEQRKRDGNKKKMEWTGVIIGETSSCYLVRLANGIKENFDKNDFRFGNLIYRYTA